MLKGINLMGQSRSILVADDEEGDIMLLQLALRKAGVKSDLLVARDGREAVDYLAGSQLPGRNHVPARPGLFLLDLKMPCMSGFDVLEWLASRPEFKDLPVVVLSSSSNEEDIQKARQMGAREYLVKPSGLQALTRLVQDVHARYLAAAA